MTALALLCLMAADPPSDVDADWSIVTIGGNPVGYEYSRTDETGEGLESESVSLLSMKRFGQDFEMRMRMLVVEDEAGRLKSFRMEQASPGQPTQVSSGTAEGNTLTLTTPSAGGAATRTVTLDDDTLAPTALEAILTDDPPGPGQKRTVKTFAIETLEPVEFTLEGLGPVETAGRDGKTLRLRGVKITRSDMPLTPTYYLDGEGEAVKTEMGLMNMVAWKADRASALAAGGGSDFDFGERTLLRVSPSPGLDRKASARYRVTGADLPELPGSQSVTPRGEATIVTVTTPSVVGEDVTDAPGESYLASTRWVDWKAPEVTALAEKLDASEPAGDRAAAAEKVVRRAMTARSYGVGFASASEAAKSGEGDCTEHGVLLAGVLRASGIPSRVAYGLVYVDPAAAMVPHMWTEAHVGGRWVPLDATRPGWPDGGYLKFGDSALESDAALPTKDLLRLSQNVDTMDVRVLETSDENLAPAK